MIILLHVIQIQFEMPEQILLKAAVKAAAINLS